MNCTILLSASLNVPYAFKFYWLLTHGCIIVSNLGAIFLHAEILTGHKHVT